MRQTDTLPLDPEQREAAHSTPRRPLLVLAGPGSGKTTALVARIAHLCAAERPAASGLGAITALTFTRNAARELETRLRPHLGADLGGEVVVRTFHSFGLCLLRDGWARDYLGWERVRVATAGQMAQAAADALAHVGLVLPTAEALEVIGDQKAGHVPPDHALPSLRRTYDAWLHERQLIDVHDMLALPVAILRAQPAARRDLRCRVAHIVSDEAQDWSPCQAALVAYAGGPDGRITAVGDPKQCIFGGSTPRYLVEFPLAYARTRVVSLRRSYRLHAAVLAVANAVAAHIDGPTMMSIPAHAGGPRPIVHLTRSSTEEGAWIASELRHLRATAALRCWADAVVLVRTHAQRRRIAQALTAAGLPCRGPGATPARAPVLTALVAWLALLRDGGDSTALLHALDAHLSSRRDQAGQGLRTALTTGGPWTMERLHRECPPGLSEGQQRALARFIRLYDGLAALVAGGEPTVALDAVLERTGLHAWLAQAGRPAADQISTLRTRAAQEGDVGALQHVLSEEEVDERRDAIRVSTVHAYKGQEAEAVFLAGLDDGLFPHHQCLEHGHAGLQQELRAFYVALTRPRTRLYLSAAGEPASPDAAGCPSRFLALIPPDLLQVA